MKRILLSAFLLSGLTLAAAQVKKEDLATKNTVSPGAETSVTINGKNLWIYYHAPSVRGRHIFGGAGAHPAGWQRMASGRRLRHCSAHRRRPRPEWPRIPKGDYTLYADLDNGQWKLIVNKTLMAGAATSGAWGYHRTAFARAPPPMIRPPNWAALRSTWASRHLRSKPSRSRCRAPAAPRENCSSNGRM